MIFDRAMIAIVHCFVLRGVVFKEPGLQGLSWCCPAATRTQTVAGDLFIYLFFWMCASLLPLEYCVIAEAGCN
jgi:hypothetical protein